MRIKADLQLFHVGQDHFVVDMNTDEIDQAQLYEMNEAAAFLWEEFCNKDFTPNQMVVRLCEFYNVDADIAKHDINQMLETWSRYGMLI